MYFFVLSFLSTLLAEPMRNSILWVFLMASSCSRRLSAYLSALPLTFMPLASQMSAPISTAQSAICLWRYP